MIFYQEPVVFWIKKIKIINSDFGDYKKGFVYKFENGVWIPSIENLVPIISKTNFRGGKILGSFNSGVYGKSESVLEWNNPDAEWGGGFLSSLTIGDAEGFYDFAGSTLVHSVGGWAALVAVYLLGSRIGKFNNGKAQAIPGHSIPLATAGVLILWLGWFGFNGGSVLSADPEATSLTLVTTCLAAAAGGVIAMITSTLLYKNLDLTMFLNGILGGLVGITAGADQMSPGDAILIGAIAGALIVFAVSLVDKIKLDDPVGAIAVHLICGIWGTLAVGLFGAKAGFDQFLVQLIGVLCYGAFCVATSFIIIYTLKKTMGIRVSEREELEGLDAHEHKMDAYPDFRLNEH